MKTKPNTKRLLGVLLATLPGVILSMVLAGCVTSGSTGSGGNNTTPGIGTRSGGGTTSAVATNPVVRPR